ncbi:MAG: alkaline phosphatase family protein [Candidatus Cloacimonetes bacterium]|nr:alkaline phosphatase family protein [Candidatus Cloacimonadota bacterium]
MIPVRYSIAAITPTLCALFGVRNPSACTEIAIPEILSFGNRKLRGKLLEKCLIFAPDAIGEHLLSVNPLLFSRLNQLADRQIPMLSVVPSFTPVCFASMFTGADPDIHGIRKYEKPVVQIETLFDVLAEAGKRVAIVSVQDSSIATIFQQRDLDYYPTENDLQVIIRSETLIKAGKHDLILSYQQEYDDELHHSDPYSQAAVQASNNHLEAFLRLHRCVRRAWQKYHHLILFSPDHGAHYDALLGRGMHGTDRPEDIEITHFYTLKKARWKLWQK